MKVFRILAAVMMAALLSVTVTSCKGEKHKDAYDDDPDETVISEARHDFNESKYYVLVGSAGEYQDYIRLRYFNGDEIESVAWRITSTEYEYGDVFVAKDGTEPVRLEDPDGFSQDKPKYELSGDVKLEKIGNCRDLMETKELIVKSNDYDGGGHFSIKFVDNEANEYYYGFREDSIFDLSVSSAKEGDRYICAMNNGKIVIPLNEMPF